MDAYGWGYGSDPYGQGAGFPYRTGYGLQQLVGPAAEPVHLDELKTFLRIDSGDDSQDVILQGFLAAAREYVESALSQQIVAAQWEASWDRFPLFEEQPLSYGWFRSVLRLPRPPLLGVTSIRFVDSAGNTDTIDPSLYLVDATRQPARVTPAFGQIWPVPRWQLQAVLADFWTGYAIPFTANHSTGVITLLGPAPANGQSFRLQNSGGALPAGLLALTQYYVVQASGQTCKLSLTSGGSAVSFTDNGTGTQFAGEVPQKIGAAIRLLVSHWNENREAVAAGVLNEIPLGVDSLLGASWHGEYV